MCVDLDKRRQLRDLAPTFVPHVLRIARRLSARVCYMVLSVGGVIFTSVFSIYLNSFYVFSLSCFNRLHVGVLLYNNLGRTLSVIHGKNRTFLYMVKICHEL